MDLVATHNQCGGKDMELSQGHRGNGSTPCAVIGKMSAADWHQFSYIPTGRWGTGWCTQAGLNSNPLTLLQESSCSTWCAVMPS